MNFSTDTEEIDIRSHFQNCGPIQNVYLVCDGFSEVGHGKGYVEFEVRIVIYL